MGKHLSRCGIRDHRKGHHQPERRLDRPGSGVFVDRLSFLVDFAMDDRSSVQTSSRQPAPQFSPLLPAGVAAVESTTTVSDATLTVTERALIACAVPDRVREFATGRWC